MSDYHSGGGYYGEDSLYQDSPKYVKKKKKAAAVSLDYNQCALVLDYEVQVTLVGDSGSAIDKRFDNQQKLIKLKFKPHTDVSALAKEIVQSSELIPDNKLSHVASLVQKLKEDYLAKLRSADSDAKMRRDLKQKKRQEREREERRRLEEEQAKKALAEVENASMSDLESYVDMLYEDLPQRLQATAKIARLAAVPRNLEELQRVMDGTLIRAIARVLEDHKKHVELALNILTTFLCFSTFNNFHKTLLSEGVGGATMKVIRLHLERYRSQVEELKKARDDERFVGGGEGQHAQYNSEIKAKYRQAFRRQDKLFSIGFQLLFNLAEDMEVERKMHKRKICELLTCMFDREEADTGLLAVSAQFLRKLSVFEESKEQMLEYDAVARLMRLVPSADEKLMMTVLKTMYNLSFDAGARDQMVKNSAIPKLIDLLRKPKFRAVVLKMLYHLSADDKNKPMFALTEPPAIPIILQLIVNFPHKIVPKELTALMVNLSTSPSNLKVICQAPEIRDLIKRVLKNGDAVLCKVLRNISNWTRQMQENLASDPAVDDEQLPRRYDQRGFWSSHVEDVYRGLLDHEAEDFLVELVGVAADLTAYDLPRGLTVAELVTKYDLLEFVHRNLVPGFAKDDMVLNVVLLVGTLCLDEQVAAMVANSHITKYLYSLLSDRRQDREMVFQVLFVLYRLLRHRNTSQILYETDIASQVTQLINHRNKRLAAMADGVLSLFVDHDEAYEQQRAAKMGKPEESEVVLRGSISKEIVAKRYAAHNHQYLDLMEHEDTETDSVQGGDFEYKSSDGELFQHHAFDGYGLDEDEAIDFRALDEEY